MKKANVQIVLFAAILVAVCFLSVVVFKIPAFNKYFNLTSAEASNLGAAISGLTAPVIGIGSALLLYLALSKQVESNHNQRHKNDSDIIFTMLLQLQKEIDNFYYSTTKTDPDNFMGPPLSFRLYGIEGLNEFAWDLKGKRFSEPTTLKNLFTVPQIMMIVRSFEFINEHVLSTNLPDNTKGYFERKLSAYFELILVFPLSKIVELVSSNPSLRDEIYDELNAFFESNLHRALNKTEG